MSVVILYKPDKTRPVGYLINTILALGVPVYAPDTIVIIRKSSFVYHTGGLFAITSIKSKALNNMLNAKIYLLYLIFPFKPMLSDHRHVFIFRIFFNSFVFFLFIFFIV